MELVINGEPRQVPPGTTVAALLGLLQIQAPRIAVELNQEVVPRSRHRETALQAGDRVEIVTLVGGG